MNNKTLAILGGCAALLVVCCLASVVLVVVFDVPTQISRALGSTVEQLGETTPPIPAVGTRIAPLPGATAAPTKPSSGQPSTGDPFADAFAKAQSASKYRVEFVMAFGGMDQGKFKETPFIDLKGEVDGDNSHFVSQGGLLAMLGGKEGAPIEFIEANGKSYMKGVAMFGMTDPKVWYITDDSTASSFKDFAKPDQYDDYFGGAKPSDFKKVRTESLDGQSCDVYLYDFKTAQNAALEGLTGMSQYQNAFGAIDKAEMSIWLCRDGFVHRFILDYAGHNPKNAAEKGSLKMNGHFWDFNNPAIKVEAPKDAKPMPK